MRIELFKWPILIVMTLLCSQSVGVFGDDTHADLMREADASIEKVRKGTLVIEAAPNTEVRVEQVRHEFWFGAALSNSAFGGGRMSPQDREKYRAVFLENFNSAVTETPSNGLRWNRVAVP